MSDLAEGVTSLPEGDAWPLIPSDGLFSYPWFYICYKGYFTIRRFYCC